MCALKVRLLAFVEIAPLCFDGRERPTDICEHRSMIARRHNLRSSRLQLYFCSK
ncbi:hypothetical protein LMK08_14140 [Metapseudomonas furukawaii]|uniref:hypothetical protein n=1 Tax=Metapseudomonas furukawaii TaxID=1149133 RepID=UPI00227C9A6A|nr:hypothetical protein [Pseudomonas furukawaii]WAG76527.1 hypothetical protein LMK08_14140 [Pseudomonas furukawaii]